MSDKEIQKTPLLRFRAYVEAWERYKLGDILAVNSGKDYKHLEAGGIPVYGTGGYMLSVNDKLSSVDAVGIGRKGTIDKPQLLKAPFWTVDTLFYMTPRRHNNLYYIYALASKINWKTYDESTGVPSLSKDNIEKIVEMFPKSNEQEKIGSFFKQIDTLISFYQRELELLQLEKQTLLSKMFPKEGEVAPEIRFRGFNDDWEQWKLGEITDLLTGYPFESKQFADSGIPLVRGMNVKRGYLDMTDEICKYWVSSNGLEKYLLKDKDIVIQMDGALIGKSYAMITVENTPSLLVQRVTRVRVNNHNADYIYHCLQRGFLKYIKSIKTETAVPHLSLNDVRNYIMPLPMDNKEQHKIGDFFKYLDHIITLHQHKLETIKKIKKTLLKYMFV